MANNVSKSDSYAAAGVDITAGYKAVELMKKHIARTNIPGVVSGIGGFGGLFELDVTGMTRPVLVSGTDGVGTKLKLAFLMDKHDTVGIDCVAMCVNDIVCCGAKPLTFLDYIACGKNVPEKIAEIVSGVAEGCVQAGCALVGGETAEMPGFYPENEYDLAGFSVGVVDRDKLFDSSAVAVGDVMIGLPSSGVHSNGFSLVRKVFDVENGGLDFYCDDLGRTLGEALLEPTRIYVRRWLLREHPPQPAPGRHGLHRPEQHRRDTAVRAHRQRREHPHAGYVQHLQHGHRHGADGLHIPGERGHAHPDGMRRESQGNRRDHPR